MAPEYGFPAACEDIAIVNSWKDVCNDKFRKVRVASALLRTKNDSNVEVRKVEKKIAIVTGGASGLGAAIATRFISDGVHVVVTDIDKKRGASFAQKGDCEFLEHDVADEAQWRRIVDEVMKRHGGIHILVNNAGVDGDFEKSNPENTTLESWRKIFAINLEGVFLGCRVVIPAMQASGGGAIINMSSVASLLPAPWFTAYGAAKASVQHLTKSVAAHCISNGYNIRCNSVHPGPVLTKMATETIDEIATANGTPPEESVAGWKAKSLNRQLVEPADIANTIAFLVSHNAKRITGTDLVVDSGILLNM